MVVNPQDRFVSVFDGMQDEEIVEVARTGSVEAQEYLINKYKGFVKAKARSYFLLSLIHIFPRSDINKRDFA